MRPFWGSEDIRIQTQGDDLVFLVDISRSMYAADVAPSRLEVAKRKIHDLLAAFSTNGQIARFGITVFAGAGYTICPLTTDRGVLKQFVAQLSPDLVSSVGSNLKAGIDAALSRLDEAARTHSRVLLISDGEDNFINDQNLVKEIQAQGVRFDVLGIGTPQGTTIQLPNGTIVADRNRKPVVSTLNEPALEAIARAGGGIYVRATIDDADIAALTNDLAVARQTSRLIADRTTRSYREFGAWVALCALAIVLVSACSRTSNPLASLIAISILSTTLSLAHADDTKPTTPTSDLKSGFDLYHQGSYQQAAKAFEQQLRSSPADRDSKHGLASSLYRLGKYGESARLFGEVAEASRDGRHYFDATYNQGNALLQEQRFQDAIDAFHKALDVKPGDERASHNVEVARALLEEQKRRASEPTPTPTPAPSSAEQNESPDPQTSAAPTSQPDSAPEAAPSSSPNPQGSPSPQASAGDTQTTPESSSENKPSTPSPQPTQGSPDSGPTAQAADTTPSPASLATSQPQALASPEEHQRLKEAMDVDPQSSQQPSSPATSVPTPKSLSFPEVDAWLESLPESPLLIRPHHGPGPLNGQTW
jgi:Ca-activated chloride channel family protein